MPVISPDLHNRMDGTCERIANEIAKFADIPIIPLTRIENFEFNPELLNLKEYVLLDMSEGNWDWDMKATHLFGLNTGDFSPLFPGEHWRRFDDFVAAMPPKMTLKRELLAGNESDTVKPICYPCFEPIPEPQSREEFNSRMFEVLFNWGLSHEGRKRVHAEIWLNAGKHGYSVCDNIYHLDGFVKNEENARKWLTINTPHYYRLPISQILNINGHSKISLSLAGAGRVCFRMTESSINSVMFMWQDNILYPYQWVHNENCIRSEEGKEIETIIEALNNPNLYEIYLAGISNCKKYETQRYISEYILPLINKA